MAEIRAIAKTVLVAPNGKLLMLRRSPTAPTMANELDLAGGWLDEGERPIDGAIREIKEETGLMIDSEALTLGYSEANSYLGFQTTCYLFIAQLPSDQTITLSYEHSEWRELPLEEVMVKFTHPVWSKGLREMIQKNLLK